MRGLISKTAVDGLAAPLRGEVTLWDTKLAGFGVRVRASPPDAGNLDRGAVSAARTAPAKTYLVMYRAGGGRGAPLRKITIGRHGSPWTPDTARAEAKRILGLVAAGGDPAAVKAERRKSESMSDLAVRFMAEHVQPKRKGRTASEYQRLLDRIILPAIGNKKIVDVTRADIARLHHEGRAAPYQANRVLAVMSKMLNLSEAWGLRPDASNPCRHVERHPETSRERMLDGTELARLGNALARYRGSPFVPAAVKLLLFTGARLSEILGLRWQQVDFERGEARLPDSKTGAKTLHLPPPALAVLADLPRVDGNPFVIVGAVGGAALVNLEKPWRKIRDSAGLPDVRLHDLRHAFASVGAAGGSSLLMIGKLLGHTQQATTQRYAHLAADPVKATAASIAAQIAAALGESDGAGVVRLSGRR